MRSSAAAWGVAGVEAAQDWSSRGACGLDAAPFLTTAATYWVAKAMDLVETAAWLHCASAAIAAAYHA